MPTSLVTPAPHRELTEDEWAAMGEDEPGELVGGRLVEEEAPDVVHEVVVTWLSVYLGAWLLPRGGVIGGAARFLVGAERGRTTDVFVFLPGSPKPRRRGPSRLTLDLADLWKQVDELPVDET